MTDLPHSLPTAFYRVIDAASTEALKANRLVSFKILHSLPTWIATDLSGFTTNFIEAIKKQIAKSKARETYIICTCSRTSDGLVNLEFTATDLPGFKLSPDAKPFFNFAVKPYSERETFKHLLPQSDDANHLHVTENLLEGFCVLVVDDSPESLEYEVRLLEKFGAKAETAMTGEEAIEKALSKHFDVVLMDIKMPVLNGNDAMRTLVDRRYRMPVVALSAFSSTEERKASLKNGFADYLSKPIVPEQLVRTVARLTHRSLPVLKPDPKPDLKSENRLSI